MKALAKMALVVLLVGALSAYGEQGTSAPDSPDVLGNKIQENSRELEVLHAQIQELQAEQSALNDREKEIRRGHDEIQEEIALTGQILNEMDERERLLNRQRSDLESELAASTRRFEATRESLATHLRAMYVRGGRSQLESLMTSGSFSNFVLRTRWESMMARFGVGLVNDIRQESRLLSSRQKMLEVSLAEIHRVREDADGQRARMEELLAEQMHALRDLEVERRGLGEQLLELSMNEQRLNYILSDLEELWTRRQAENPVSPQSLASLAGHMEWPVQGELIRGFGRSVHPRFQTVTVNNGLNIAAPLGAPVAAVADGRVEFCDRLPGFGRCVILDHGAGYYTLYAHLDRAFVSAGGQLARGQVIAEVGRPAAGETPQLYFEIRQGKTPLDPTDWLRSR